MPPRKDTTKPVATPAASTSAAKPKATGRTKKTANKAGASNAVPPTPRRATRSMVLGDPALLVDARSDPMPRKRAEPRKAKAPVPSESSADSAPKEAQQHEENEQVEEKKVPLPANDKTDYDDDDEVEAILFRETDEERELSPEADDSKLALISRASVESEDAVQQMLARMPSPSPAPAPVEEDLTGVLPMELWFEIAEYLQKPELAIVSRVCKALEYFCRPLLYREILYPGQHKMKPQNAQILFLRLIKQPEIASLVRVFNAEDIQMPAECVGLFYRALSGMHNLEVLCLAFGMPGHRLDMTLPKLRMLKVNRPVPKDFIYRHTHLEALDIIFDHMDGPVPFGPGDDLKFLRSNYYVAYNVLVNPASRRFAKDALLQIHLPHRQVDPEDPGEFFEALEQTHQLPGMIELDRFVLRHFARFARVHAPAQNRLRHLRIHINASKNIVDPNVARPYTERYRYLYHVRQVLKAFAHIRVLELRDFMLKKGAGEDEVDAWLTPDVCEVFRIQCVELTTVIGPSGKTLKFNIVQNAWVDAVEPEMRLNPFYAALDRPLWT